MRPIGRLPDETHAKRFTDFLYGKGIESQTEADSHGQWEIWVLDEDQIETAAALLDAFVKQPDDARYVSAARKAETQRQCDLKASVPKRARVVDGRTLFYKPPVGFGLLTLALMAISVAVALLTRLGNDDRLVQFFTITRYSIEGYTRGLPEIRHGQIWRLFTPMFIHFGLIHILFNMLWLRDLGSMIEARKGSWLLLVLLLVIAALSNVVQYAIAGPAFGGMSGVVYGLLGYVWMQGKFKPASGLALHPQTVTMMIVWFFLCLSGVIGHVANGAHAAGAVVGIIWGYLSARLR
jgi:GlpG protein